MAYTRRVADRLTTVEAEVVAAADAELSGALLPVLAERNTAIDAAFTEQFPQTRASSVRGGWDGLGRERGWAAGGRAQLGRDEAGSAGGERGALGA